MTTSLSRSRASWLSRSEAQSQLLLREEAGLDPPRQLHLLRRGEQRDPADLPQVLAEQVGRGPAGVRTGARHFHRLRRLGLHEGDGRLVGLGRRALRLRRGLGVVRDTALRRYGRDDVGIRVRVGGVVGLGEGLGLHGGDLQECRC